MAFPNLVRNPWAWARWARWGFKLLLLIAAMALMQLFSMWRSCEKLPEAPILQSTWAKARPTLDGRVQPEEWAHARTYSARRERFDHLGNKVGEHTATLYLQNDDQNLYVATVWKNCPYHDDWKGTPNTNAADAFLLCLDDDRKIVIADHGKSRYEDEHIPTDLIKDERRDVQQDGYGVLTHSNPRGRGTYQVEFLVPLNAHDPQDGVWRPGAPLRLNVLYYENYNPDRTHTRRAGLFGRSDWQPKKRVQGRQRVLAWSLSEWAQVRLATGP